MLRLIKSFIKSMVSLPRRVVANVYYYQHNKHLKSKVKIIYAGLPTARLRNLGDHAQVIAVQKWLSKNYPNYHILELNKDEIHYYYYAYKYLVNNEDLFILQSGGNMDVLGKWSETGRRRLIKNFKGNKIVILPQTIYFSDTDLGRREKKITSELYSQHPNLTVIARDIKSYQIAEQLFSGVKVLLAPDFVLSLEPLIKKVEKINQTKGRSVLFCFRKDKKSLISPSEIEYLKDKLPYKFEEYNTYIEIDVAPDKREEHLYDLLNVFNKHDLVVTDRFHGLIFSVMCNKPCIVFPTIDHKLTYGVKWFDSYNSIRLVAKPEEIIDCIESMISAEEHPSVKVNWNAKYFDKLPELL